MTHATPEEIHDHAYGFRLSEHVAVCADCRRAAEAVSAERASLREAIAEEAPAAPEAFIAQLGHARPTRLKLAPAALAAAALFLVALGWILYQPPVAPFKAKDPVRLNLDEEMDRLIAELRSPLPLHREIARLALKKYGGTAVEKLEKARVDPVLTEECRGYFPEDLQLIRSLKEKRVSMEWKDVSLVVAIDQLREKAGVSCHISGVDDPEQVKVSLQIRDLSVWETLERLKTLTRLPFDVTCGSELSRAQLVNPPPRQSMVIFGQERAAPASWAPIRILAIREWAVQQPGELLRSKQTALGALERLRNAADPALWDFLDSPDADLRDLAWGELRHLYDPPQPLPKPSPLLAVLDKKRLDLSFENTAFFDVLSFIAQTEGISIVVPTDSASARDKKVTFKVKDLLLKNTLKLLLSQFLMDYLIVDDMLLLTPPHAVHAWSNPSAPFWTSIEEAGAAEILIDDLASPDLTRQESARTRVRDLGRPALGWLRHAAQILDGDAAQRCRSLRRSLAEEQGIWTVDQTSGAELQTLSAAQKGLLDRPLTLNSGDRTLEQILRGENLPCLFKAKMEEPLLLCAQGLKLGSLLKAATRSRGLDFYVDGATIVVDTAANVRAAVGQP